MAINAILRRGYQVMAATLGSKENARAALLGANAGASALLRRGRIGALALRNRIIVTAMGRVAEPRRRES